MKIPLILVSNKIGPWIKSDQEVSAESTPRRDYIEMARRLGADLCGYDQYDANWYHLIRRTETRLKIDFSEAIYAASRTSNYCATISLSEKAALPLAAIQLASRKNIPHIVIAHKLSSGLKSKFMKLLPVHKTFSHLICISSSQVEYAKNVLRFPETNVSFIYANIDQNFYKPIQLESEDFILSVGKEQRDYQTLLKAIAGTDIKLVVVASSPWSSNEVKIENRDQVSVLSNIPYEELKSLYAKARMVIVPLHDVDYAAGVTTLLEAMAMGKPVIVSNTKGLSDYILHDETGVYFTPMDDLELRDTILTLWEKPDHLSRLGRNARQVVEESMNIDLYVDNVVEIVNQYCN
jgi:glycosyltransferase involved in cell wall biosynthesis